MKTDIMITGISLSTSTQMRPFLVKQFLMMPTLLIKPKGLNMTSTCLKASLFRVHGTIRRRNYFIMKEISGTGRNLITISKLQTTGFIFISEQ